MTVFCSGTKGDLDRRCCKQPANLLFGVIEESVPTAHLYKTERADIVDSFKDLCQEYWANGQGDLKMVPVMDAAELTLTILSYAQHLAEIATWAQKTSNKNAWATVQVQAKLKTRTKEVTALKEQVSKKLPTLYENLSPQLERALKEAELSRNQLAHVKAEIRDLRGSYEELQAVLHRLADGEAKITCLQELVQKEKPPNA